MPKLEVEDVGTFDVQEGKRLVLAIEEDAGVDILHGVGSKLQSGSAAVQTGWLSCLANLAGL
jgi:hypothetical protein